MLVVYLIALLILGRTFPPTFSRRKRVSKIPRQEVG
jgi:hypothetical protein